MLASHAGKALKGCSWVGVVFAGGMSEVREIDARTLLVNDKHRHVINLAQCVACPEGHTRLMEYLDATAFHPDALAAAQKRCRQREADDKPFVPEWGDVPWAIDYFVSAWMARNGKAGCDDEFEAGMSIRWEPGGGDSAIRFRNATESINEWHTVMRRCTFTTLDAFEFLDNCKDRPKHGIYSDAPWPEDGDDYRHKFTPQQQRRLAEKLATFEQTRVVVRFGDHPLIRELYPEDLWTWNRLTGRTSANKGKAEVLLVRN